MAGVNKAILIGHVGRDPDVRRMNSGDAVVTFSVATSETWRDKGSGERKERTEWHNVVIFNEGLCKLAEQYLKKGSKVYLEGKIQSREYEDKDGIKRRTTEIVLNQFRGELTLLDKSDKSDRPAPEPDSYGTTRTRAAPQHDDPRQAMGDGRHSDRSVARDRQRMADIIDDDIPF